MDTWTLWQLVDSAFPTGGFAHSGGLEAAWQLGRVAALEPFLADALEHAAAGGVPLVAAAHADPEGFAALDALADAALTNHVANRASRAQGSGLLRAAAAAFGDARIAELRARAAAAHLAPVTGFVAAALGASRQEACRLYVFQALRGLLASAVRLGAVGPMEAQGIQARLSGVAERCAARYGEVGLDEVAATDPLLELAQMHQDRLYSRLFSS